MDHGAFFIPLERGKYYPNSGFHEIDSKDTNEFDKSREAVCRIFKEQIDTLRAEIDQIPIVNQQYCCSKRAFLDVSTLGCCVAMCIPGVIWAAFRTCFRVSYRSSCYGTIRRSGIVLDGLWSRCMA